MKRILLYITLLLSGFYAQAQQVDSTALEPVEEEKKQKNTKFIFSFDGRRSFVLKQPVRFSGLRIGLEYKEVHDFGLGFYGTRNPVQQELRDQPFSVQAEFNYTTIFYQYAFYHNEKWELAVPLHLGSGKANLAILHTETGDPVLDEQGDPLIIRDLPFGISEFGLAAQYKIFPWFGLGSGAGYRFVLSSNDDAKRVFNAPTYTFKIKIFLGELYRTVKRAVKDESKKESE